MSLSLRTREDVPEQPAPCSRGHRPSVRILSFLLCLGLAQGQVLGAEAGLPLTARSGSNQHPRQPAFELPKELGSVEVIHEAGGPRVYYIQDAHDSLEAQENIAKIIHFLTAQQGVRTVLEEGYEGPVPTDQFFSIFKDPGTREKAAYFLMDQLRMGGAEYAHITRRDDFQLIGADSFDLHAENLEWYKKTAEVRAQAEEDLRAVRNEIEALAQKQFPKEVKEALRLKERFDRQEVPLAEYLKRLPLEQGHGYPHIEKVLAITALPRDRAEDALDENFAMNLFEEMDRAEDSAASGRLTTAQHFKIYRFYKSVRLLERLLRIEISSRELPLAVRAAEELKTAEAARFLSEFSGQPIILSNRWEKQIRYAFEFYKAAEKRDRFLEKKLRAAEFERAVLVYGGFHKDAVTEILRKHGFSYAVIRPRIQEISPKHQMLYKRLMAGQIHDFETPFMAARAAPPLRALTLLRNAPEPKSALARYLSNTALARLSPDAASALREQLVSRGAAAGGLRSELRADPRIQTWSEAAKRLMEPNLENREVQALKVFRSLLESIDEPGLKEDVQRIAFDVEASRGSSEGGLGENAYIPAKGLSAFHVLRAMALYLLDKSSRSLEEEPFLREDLESLEDLIRIYNRQTSGVSMPLDLPSLLYYSRSHLIPDNARFERYAVQFARLPRRYLATALALYNYTQAVHLDGPEKSDTHHEISIMVANLTRTFELLRSHDLETEERRRLEFSLARFQLFFMLFLGNNYGRAQQGLTLSIRDGIPDTLEKRLTELIADNIDLLDAAFTNYEDKAPKRLTPDDFRDFNLLEKDYFLHGLRLAYILQDEAYLFKGLGPSPVTLTELLLDRQNGQAVSYLNRALTSLLTRHEIQGDYPRQGFVVQHLPPKIFDTGDGRGRDIMQMTRLVIEAIKDRRSELRAVGEADTENENRDLLQTLGWTRPDVLRVAKEVSWDLPRFYDALKRKAEAAGKNFPTGKQLGGMGGLVRTVGVQSDFAQEAVLMYQRALGNNSLVAAYFGVSPQAMRDWILPRTGVDFSEVQIPEGILLESLKDNLQETAQDVKARLLRQLTQPSEGASWDLVRLRADVTARLPQHDYPGFTYAEMIWALGLTTEFLERFDQVYRKHFGAIREVTKSFGFENTKLTQYFEDDAEMLAKRLGKRWKLPEKNAPSMMGLTRKQFLQIVSSSESAWDIDHFVRLYEQEFPWLYGRSNLWIVTEFGAREEYIERLREPLQSAGGEAGHARRVVRTWKVIQTIFGQEEFTVQDYMALKLGPDEHTLGRHLKRLKEWGLLTSWKPKAKGRYGAAATQYRAAAVKPQFKRELEFALDSYLEDGDERYVQPQIEAILAEKPLFVVPGKGFDYLSMANKLDRRGRLKNSFLPVTYELLSGYLKNAWIKSSALDDHIKNTNERGRTLREHLAVLEDLGLVETVRLNRTSGLWIRAKPLGPGQTTAVKRALMSSRSNAERKYRIRNILAGERVLLADDLRWGSPFAHAKTSGKRTARSDGLTLPVIVQAIHDSTSDGMEEDEPNQPTLQEVTRRAKAILGVTSANREYLTRFGQRYGIDLPRLGIFGMQLKLSKDQESARAELDSLVDQAVQRLREGDPRYQFLPISHRDLADEMGIMTPTKMLGLFRRHRIDFEKKGIFVLKNPPTPAVQRAYRTFLESIQGSPADEIHADAQRRGSSRDRDHGPHDGVIAEVQEKWRYELPWRRAKQKQVYLNQVVLSAAQSYKALLQPPGEPNSIKRARETLEALSPGHPVLSDPEWNLEEAGADPGLGEDRIESPANRVAEGLKQYHSLMHEYQERLGVIQNSESQTGKLSQAIGEFFSFVENKVLPIASDEDAQAIRAVIASFGQKQPTEVFKEFRKLLVPTLAALYAVNSLSRDRWRVDDFTLGEEDEDQEPEANFKVLVIRNQQGTEWEEIDTQTESLERWIAQVHERQENAPSLWVEIYYAAGPAAAEEAAQLGGMDLVWTSDNSSAENMREKMLPYGSSVPQPSFWMIQPFSAKDISGKSKDSLETALVRSMGLTRRPSSRQTAAAESVTRSELRRGSQDTQAARSGQGGAARAADAATREEAQSLLGRFWVPVDMEVFEALSNAQRAEFYKTVRMFADNGRVQFAFFGDATTAVSMETEAWREVLALDRRYNHVRFQILTGGRLPDLSAAQGRRVLAVTREGAEGIQAEKLKKELSRRPGVVWLKYLSQGAQPGLLLSALQLVDSAPDEQLRSMNVITANDIPSGLLADMNAILRTYELASRSA